MMDSNRLNNQAASLKPASFTELDSSDDALLGKAFTGWKGIYQQVERKPFHEEITELWTWPLQIVRERLHHPCIYRGEAWKGALSFFSYVGLDSEYGEKVNFQNTGSSLFMIPNAIQPRTIATLPRDQKGAVYINGPIMCITVSVDETVFRNFFHENYGKALSLDLLQRGVVISDEKSTQKLQNNCLSILNEISAEPEIIKDKVYRARTVADMMDMLASIFSPDFAQPESLIQPSTRTYIVNKAIQYMEEHLADPFPNLEICNLLRISQRTLRYSFKEVVGVSPCQYFLSLRLDHVHRELLKARGKRPIHCIAQCYGFSHMGRFAKFYRESYGESPSETCFRVQTNKIGVALH